MNAVITVLQMFCDYGGPYIAPLYMPIFGLINVMMFPVSLCLWSILLLSIFTPVITAPPGILNSDDNQTKNGGKAFGYSFLIYYIVMIIIYCIIMQLTCKAKDSLNL